MKRTMFFVVIALIPTLLFGIWNVGYQHALSCGDGMPCMAEFYIGKATNEPAPLFIRMAKLRFFTNYD